MDTGLAGKSALITGGSRGIGRAIAFALAAEGCHVMITSRKRDVLDATAAEIRAAHTGVRIETYAAHAGDPEQAEACVKATVEAFGGIDVLVNNAATNPFFGNLVDLDLPRAEKIVRLNQYGVVLWTQIAWRNSMAERGGAVINLASIGGMSSEIGIGYYNATKAAVIHLTRQFAAELAPRVRVNGIAPGLVRTDLARALWEPAEELVAKNTPLGRIGEPDDIAKAAVFLAGDMSSWLTGQTIVVDGGMLVRMGGLG
jgi:NAD(P)-dependent dehydrogenase (short-subunit alcohol dehydrogenase family)